MNRLTISLTEPRYRALKQAAAKRGKSIRQLIDESLEFYGIKTDDEARALVDQARRRSRLSERQALELANEQVQAQRRS